jgi:hypothetical protein
MDFYGKIALNVIAVVGFLMLLRAVRKRGGGVNAG